MTRATTRFEGDVELPRSTPRRDAPAALRGRWTTYQAALSGHDDGHLRKGQGRTQSALFE